MEEFYQSCLGLMDPLSSSSSSSPHISVVPNELLFNHKMSSSLSTSSVSSRFVSITSHTRGKLRYSVPSCLGCHYVVFLHDTVLDKNMCFCVQYCSCCMSFCSSVVWTVAQDSPFTVSPTSCDLAPLKSTSFRVTYDPKQINTLHGAQLECFAFYKVIL